MNGLIESLNYPNPGPGPTTCISSNNEPVTMVPNSKPPGHGSLSQNNSSNNLLNFDQHQQIQINMNSLSGRSSKEKSNYNDRDFEAITLALPAYKSPKQDSSLSAAVTAASIVVSEPSTPGQISPGIFNKPNLGGPVTTKTTKMVKKNSFNKRSSNAISNNENTLPSSQLLNDNSSPMSSLANRDSNINPMTMDDVKSYPFKLVLKAPTSPACKKFEETLTYLNQSDSYELELQKVSDEDDDLSLSGKSSQHRSPWSREGGNCGGNTNLRYDNKPEMKKFIQDQKLFFVCLRVSFQETRQHLNMQQHWKDWYIRTKMRVLNIDKGVCVNAEKPTDCPAEIFTSTFIWDSSKGARVNIQLHCISTEFTQRRRGGERGVPFKIYCDIYCYPLVTNVNHLPSILNNRDEFGLVGHNNEKRAGSDDTSTEEREKHIVSKQLLYTACCQVKVFKKNGATRKMRTDVVKLEKLSLPEKQKFRPATQWTILEGCKPLVNGKGMTITPPMTNIDITEEYLRGGPNSGSNLATGNNSGPWQSDIYNNNNLLPTDFNFSRNAPSPVPSNCSNYTVNSQSQSQIHMPQGLPPAAPTLPNQSDSENESQMITTQNEAIHVNVNLNPPKDERTEININNYDSTFDDISCQDFNQNTTCSQIEGLNMNFEMSGQDDNIDFTSMKISGKDGGSDQTTKQQISNHSRPSLTESAGGMTLSMNELNIQVSSCSGPDSNQSALNEENKTEMQDIKHEPVGSRKISPRSSLDGAGSGHHGHGGYINSDYMRNGNHQNQQNSRINNQNQNQTPPHNIIYMQDSQTVNNNQSSFDDLNAMRDMSFDNQETASIASNQSHGSDSGSTHSASFNNMYGSSGSYNPIGGPNNVNVNINSPSNYVPDYHNSYVPTPNSHSDSSHVQMWLYKNNFDKRQALSNYTGADLLRLSKAEMIDILQSKSLGIRLFNTLHARPIAAIKTLFISFAIPDHLKREKNSFFTEENKLNKNLFYVGNHNQGGVARNQNHGQNQESMKSEEESNSEFNIDLIDSIFLPICLSSTSLVEELGAIILKTLKQECRSKFTGQTSSLIIENIDYVSEILLMKTIQKKSVIPVRLNSQFISQMPDNSCFYVDIKPSGGLGGSMVEINKFGEQVRLAKKISCVLYNGSVG